MCSIAANPSTCSERDEKTVVSHELGIWHNNMLPRKVVWVANRDWPVAVTGSLLSSLRVSSNGRLELVDGKQNSVWSTNVSSSYTSSVASVLLDDGNCAVKDVIGAGQTIWQSFDYPGDTMLPTQQMEYNTKSKKGTILTAWRSETDLSSGIFTVEGGRKNEIPAQVIIWINRSTAFWRSAPWDKSKFVGVPEMDDQYVSGFRGEENVEEGTQYFTYDKPGTLAYIDITSHGNFELVYSIDELDESVRDDFGSFCHLSAQVRQGHSDVNHYSYVSYQHKNTTLFKYMYYRQYRREEHLPEDEEAIGVLGNNLIFCLLQHFSNGESNCFCVEKAWKLWYEGKGLELVDEALGDSYSSSEVLKCLHIGLLCVQDDAATDRPTMKDIALMISSEKDGPQPKRPVFTIRNSFSHHEPRYERTNSSVNEATITVTVGR